MDGQFLKRVDLATSSDGLFAQGCGHSYAFAEGQYWYRLVGAPLGSQTRRFAFGSASSPRDGARVRPLHASAGQVIKAFLQVKWRVLALCALL